MGDLDIYSLIKELSELPSDKILHTPLLKNKDNGEYYVLREGIQIDDDGDIIILIESL